MRRSVQVLWSSIRRRDSLCCNPSRSDRRLATRRRTRQQHANKRSNETMATIWDEVSIGRLTLPHRFAMAPMTRSRAAPDGTPGPLAAEYYAQRASLGLLISEGAQPSDDGQGYLWTPGIYIDRQVAGWRRV